MRSELRYEEQGAQAGTAPRWQVFLLPGGMIVAGLFVLQRGTPWASVGALLIICGVGIGCLFFALPAVRGIVSEALHWLSYKIGLAVGRILLTLVFFGLITPLGLLLRWRRKDPITKRPDPAQPTYWEEPTPHGGLERMF